MSNSAAGLMAADEFDRVASTCRWSTRSLDVAKAQLVHGKTSAEAAEGNQMTANQAGVLKRRFQAKALAASQKKLSAADFMQAVKPEGDAVLDPFRRELAKLARSGYTTEQLRIYLAKNGISITEATLALYLTKAIKNANPRSSK